MYSAIEHVAKSLCMKAEDLMAEFTVYFDDSGTHNESDIAVAACFLSDVPRWTDFEKAWNAALHDAGLLDKGFHMADFVARQSPYRWNDPSKHDEVIKKLIGIINDHALGGMVTAVSKADYDQTIQGKLREKLGSRHYTFAIQGCLAQIEEWLRGSTFSGEAIGYVFDQMGKGKNEINNLFDDLLANKLAVHFGIDRTGGPLAIAAESYSCRPQMYSHGRATNLHAIIISRIFRRGLPLAVWLQGRYSTSVFLRGQPQGICSRYGITVREVWMGGAARRILSGCSLTMSPLSLIPRPAFLAAARSGQGRAVVCAAERTLDGEDRCETIPEQGKGARVRIPYRAVSSAASRAKPSTLRRGTLSLQKRNSALSDSWWF